MEEPTHGPDVVRPGAGEMPFPIRGPVVERYLHNRLWLRGDNFSPVGEGEARFADEGVLWRAVWGDELWETARLRLEDFYLMDWLPLEPGLYYAPESAAVRNRAADRVISRSEEGVVFDPAGKEFMVDGGIGCVRVAIKEMFGDGYKLLSATSTGRAHAGFVVAVPEQEYATIAEGIAGGGCVRCTIFGEFRRLVVDYGNWASPIGRMMIRAERLQPSHPHERPDRLAVSPLITFEATDEADESGTRQWFAYTISDPAKPGDLRRGKEWLASYVDSYRGHLVTDYDEWDVTSRAVCPLRRVMDSRVSATGLATLLEAHGMPQAVVVIEKLYAANLEMADMSTNVQITGDGNVVVGDNSQVVATINTTLARDPERYAAAEALALLRGEIETLDVPLRYKRRSERAIQDAEDELGEDSPDPDGVHTALQRVTDTMNDAGETYDTATGWARRLADAVGVISRLIPQAAGWLPL
jgi:hypothetical protein